MVTTPVPYVSARRLRRALVRKGEGHKPIMEKLSPQFASVD